MPIDIDDFETAPLEELQGESLTVRGAILEFLSYNPELAYSREEIQSAIDVDAIAVLHALAELEREDLVRHRGRYWAIAEGHDLGDPSLGEPL